MNTIFLVVGESGSGKTSITNVLENKYGLKSIQSYTTRKPRYKNERGHTFISNAEFDKLTDMVAFVEFDKNRYCATTEQVENNDLYVIDPKGIEYFREHYKGKKAVKVIYIKSDLNVRYERMRKRYENSYKDYQKAVDSALGRIKNDIEAFYEYNHGIIKADLTVQNNDEDDINDVAEKVHKFIQECEKEE